MTYTSVGDLFIAGILPGILSVLMYMIMVTIRASRNPRLCPIPTVAISWGERFKSLGQMWSIILLFATVIGGLYSGIATPTEVGALGCFVVLLMMFWKIYRGQSTWGMLRAAVLDTVKMCAMLFAFIIGASIFTLFVTYSGFMPIAINAISNSGLPPFVIFCGIVAIYIPLGMVFDPVGMMLITLPFVFPIIVEALGFNAIWFGIILIKFIELSMITPPVGLNLFVMKTLFPDISLNTIVRGCGWYFVVEMITIAILIAFPIISTWLPSMMGGH
jgi:tripartite ATP-independent transporter DctM subunit